MLCRPGYLMSQSGHSRFDFFVDSVNGLDSNSGLSPSAPKRTISAASALLGTTPYKSIGLARGSYWREQLQIGTSGSPVNGTRVGTYGGGARPILDAADVAAAGGWSKTAGLTNTYQFSVTVPNNINNSTWVNAWDAGTQQQQVASSAVVDTTAGSYFVVNTAGAQTLFVHTSDGSNPGVNGRTYEYSNRCFGLSLAGVGVSVDGVETKRQVSGDGSLALYGQGSVIKNCIARQGNKHNCYVDAGAGVSSSQFIDGYFGPAGVVNLLVGFSNTGSALGFTVLNCSFSQSVAITAMGGTSCWESHVGSGTYGPLVFKNIRATATNGATLTGIAWNNAGSTALIDGFIGSELQSCVGPSSNVTINNLQHVSSAASNSAVNIGTASVSVTVTNSLACCNNIQNGIIRSTAAGTMLTLTGNKFYIGATNSGAAHVFDQSGTLTLTSSGNVFDGASAAFVYNLFHASSNPTLTSDNNIFVDPNNKTFLIGTAAQYNTVAAYVSGTGQDTHSTTSGSAIGACSLPP